VLGDMSLRELLGPTLEAAPLPGRWAHGHSPAGGVTAPQMSRRQFLGKLGGTVPPKHSLSLTSPIRQVGESHHADRCPERAIGVTSGSERVADRPYGPVRHRRRTCFDCGMEFAEPGDETSCLACRKTGRLARVIYGMIAGHAEVRGTGDRITDAGATGTSAMSIAPIE